MRVAIVHDYIKEYGGAERVLEALHEIWPNVPIFTTVYLPEFLGPHKERFRNWDIRTSFLQYIPFKEKLISPFRIIAPFVFKSFDLSKFDIVIISATGAYTPNNINCHPERKRRISLQFLGDSSVVSLPQNDNKKRPIHVCYCHTPPRYLYGYATARDWKKNLIFRVIGEIANHFLRLVDFKSSQNVDYFIANSKNVGDRIEKFYRREAVIIYPPVDIKSKINPRFNRGQKSKLQVKSQNKGYYLAGGRLARPKHIDLIVEACRELKVPLKVFGRAFGGWEKDIGTESRHSGKPRSDAAHPESPTAIRDAGQASLPRAVDIAFGDVRPKLQRRRASMTDSKLEFVGEVSDEEKLELMRNAKAFIFAAEDEDFGITPVEAMSVGTPVIAYRLGGVVESIIDGKTGIFYRFNDLSHLSEAVNKFEKMKSDKETIMKHAQKFSKERFKKEIKEFVEKIYASKEK